MKITKKINVFLIAQHENNLTLPAWTKQIYPEPLRTIVRETIYLHIYHPIGKRLTAGMLPKYNDLLKSFSSVLYYPICF